MNSYDYIASKINVLKTQYSSLRNKPDYYVFSALFVKVAFYKNPDHYLNESDLNKIIVDGSNDCGIDILLLDPDSDEEDLIIGQSKFCKTITSEEILQAMYKMADGYKELRNGHYEMANTRLSSRFAELEVDEESKIRFVFYTSAPKKRINIKRLETKFLETFYDTDNIEVKILFDSDIKKEIHDAATWKPLVESDKIYIDKAGNCLRYGEEAAIVNVSAFSIKELYTRHETNLLSLNLRYHIVDKKRDGVDNGIKTTIDTNPELFWLKNNGLTIICDDFRIDGREVHLENFSVVNGGQTTYQLYKSESIYKGKDFWLPCKIIKSIGETKDEKTDFSLAIAHAANAQKPITQEDLKVNAPEQMSFAQAMKAVGVLYKTKRGEEVDKKYRKAYLNTNLAEVGKLCLAAIFQEPCKSRNNPSASYNDPDKKQNIYYNPIFKDNPEQVAKICKELLYIDYYFDKIFQPKFDTEHKNKPGANYKVPFANNARRICLAFTALAARYHQGNITDQDLKKIRAAAKPQTDSAADDMYKAVRDIGSMQSLFPKKLSENMDLYDAALDKLFTAIIEEGILAYSFACDDKPNLTANSFLQDDKNYYAILKRFWDARFAPKIKEVFAEI